jgi:hypothetical protein
MSSRSAIQAKGCPPVSALFFGTWISSFSAPHANHTSSIIKIIVHFGTQFDRFGTNFDRFGTDFNLFGTPFQFIDLFMSICYPRYCTVRPLGAL